MLAVLGEAATQEYLLSEIQKVYRLQGVTINDKHLEVILARMFGKVRVTDPGDTEFFHDEQVDRENFAEANRNVVEMGGKPAEGEPILLGITKASLQTDSRRGDCRRSRVVGRRRSVFNGEYFGCFFLGSGVGCDGACFLGRRCK